MTFEEFVSTGIPTLGFVAAIAWFGWMRYQQLETRLDGIEAKLTEIHHTTVLNRQAVQANYDHHEYLINDCYKRIDHRTERLRDEIRTGDNRLGKDLDEVKAFLAKTTAFVIRREDSEAG